MIFVVPAAGGPSWTDVLTAIGTVGAVVVALGIALYADWRAGKRIKDEHQRADGLLTEQRQQAEDDLAEQRRHEQDALEEERRHSRFQLEEERELALDRERIAQAYLVQVGFGQRDPGQGAPDVQGRRSASAIRQLGVMVVNRGSFTITRVEAQFVVENTIIPHDRYERLSGAEALPQALQRGFDMSIEWPLRGVLTPWDIGIRFQIDGMDVGQVADWYPIVRWTDRWGARWEHKKGVVRRITDETPWER
jgi:hypothetical protein